jgi:hypothetical protein
VLLADENEPTLMSNAPVGYEDEAPVTLRMPYPAPLMRVMDAMPAPQTLEPRTPAWTQPPVSSPSRVEHVVLRPRWGWTEFVLGVFVAISITTALYLCADAWRPLMMRLVSARTPATLSVRAASTPVRGRAPEKARVRPRVVRPAAPAAAQAPATEEIAPESILDDGLVALADR